MRGMILAGAGLMLMQPGGMAAELRVLPAEITLHGREARHGLMALPVEDDYAAAAVELKWSSADDSIARVVGGGILVPVADGATVLRAVAADGRVAEARVTVTGMMEDWRWSFRNEVMPVLTKATCNSGACHGALAGKGGFLLSLLGYDAEFDFQSITRGARGRRVELAEPGVSLLLTKPTAAVPHKGGKLLDVNSRDYRVLAQWIADGATGPKEVETQVESVEVLPERSLLKVGESQRLKVLAHYSDGRVVDVTEWSKFTSANEVVATVDAKTGEVRVIGHGEGAITAWFDSRIVLARVTVPFAYEVPAEVYGAAERRNFIDGLVLEQLEKLRLRPSPRSGDSDFIRRAFVDTIGVLPTADEVRHFLADDSPDKRERLIDALLARSEFVDYWTFRWADLLMISGRQLRPEAVKAYYGWLRQRVAENAPWDELARQLVTAKGSSFENGATNFFAVNQEPETMAENVSQTFMALSINCAKCHNHPLEKWTNDQYYAFANLFSRVRAKGWGGDARDGDGLRTLYVEPHGELLQPRTGKPQVPAPLDGEPLDPAATADRRVALAGWLTAADNPYFTRTIANRVWAAFFGMGLVEPVDDLRASNPASNEPLLAALADYLVANQFDLKRLMRVILMSETYQRSHETLAENAGDSRYFSRHYPRRMLAEVLHDAIADVTGVPAVFDQVMLQDGSVMKTDFYPPGTRAMQLYDSAVASYFLKTFGRNERDIACECERSVQPSMVQVMHLSNGDTINEKIQQPHSRVSELLRQTGDPGQLLEEVYLSCLARLPSASEKKAFGTMLQGATDPDSRRELVEDLFWALLTSREFLFQH